MSEKDGPAVITPVSASWADAEVLHPECSAAWCRDGGEEWMGAATPTIITRKLGGCELRVLREGTPRTTTSVRPTDVDNRELRIDRHGSYVVITPGVQFGVALWRPSGTRTGEDCGRWIFSPPEKTRPLSDKTEAPTMASLPGAAELRRLDEVGESFSRRLQDDIDTLADRRAYLADGVELPTRRTYPATEILDDTGHPALTPRRGDSCPCDECVGKR